mgnify:CR=1 FL=1
MDRRRIWCHTTGTPPPAASTRARDALSVTAQPLATLRLFFLALSDFAVSFLGSVALSKQALVVGYPLLALWAGTHAYAPALYAVDGALFCRGELYVLGGEVRISEVDWSDNVAKEGGAMALDQADVVARDITALNGRAESGAAVWAEGAQVDLTRTTFADGRADTVAALLEAGANPNVVDKDKNTLLHTTESSELMRALLTAGANFKQKNQASGPFQTIASSDSSPSLTSQSGAQPRHLDRRRSFAQENRLEKQVSFRVGR